MRVLVLQAPARDERAGGGERLDHRLVGPSVAALVVEDALPGEERDVGIIGGILRNRVRHFPGAAGLEGGAVFDEGVVVVGAVPGGGVDEAGAGIVGDVVGLQDGNVEIPIAVAAGDAAEGMRAARDHDGQHVLDALKGGHARGGEDLAGELVGEDVALARPRPVVGGRVGDAIKAVGDIGPEGDGAVGRDRPGRRRPDQDRGALEVAVERVDDRELDPDRRRGLLVVFDLGFGERRLLHGRPHDRLRAAVELVGHRETHDLAGDLRLRRESHGRIGMLPVAFDAEALELLALHVDPFLGEGAALAAELDDRHRVLVLAASAIGLLDLPLDRQAVAVPAGHVVGILAEHPLRAHDEVLEDLVEGVADMDVAVGVGRAVVQDEARPPLPRLAQPPVEVHAVPAREEQRLALRQPGAHRELRLRQEQGLGIIPRRLGGVPGGLGLGGLHVGHGARL